MPVVLILLFLVSYAREVEVKGNTHHSAQQIADDLGGNFFENNTLVLMWKYHKKTSVESIPYLNSISVKMKAPWAITVNVTEKELAGCVEQGDFIYFDTDGYIQEISPERADDVPLVKGVVVEEPVLYQKLPIVPSDRMRTILSITGLLATKQAEDDRLQAKEIIFDESNNNDIIVRLKGGLTTMLGQDEYLEEKIANLRAIVKTMDGSLAGVLHLESVNGSKEGLISFTPGDESDIFEPETTGAEGEDGENVENAEGNSDIREIFDFSNDGVGTTDGAENQEQAEDYVSIDMVFNSSGTLIYNVHVSNGMVLDAYGNEVPGCYVNEDGNVVDAYMNTFSGVTGSLMN